MMLTTERYEPRATPLPEPAQMPGAQAMTLGDLLAQRPPGVICASPAMTTELAARLMVEHSIGALVVLQDSGAPPYFHTDKVLPQRERDIIGIVTEREVFSRVLDDGQRAKITPLCDWMTRHVTTIEREASLSDAMQKMADEDLAYLPVVHEGVLVGIVSHGDLVQATVEAGRRLVEHLKDCLCYPG